MGRNPLPLILCIALVVVALITVVVGFYAHFASDWRRWQTKEKKREARGRYNGLHNFCDEDHFLLKMNWEPSSKYPKPPNECPDIAMEQAFLALAVICLLGAILSVLLAFMDKGDNTALKLLNTILQAFLALLICLGAILFIVSAIQAQGIHDFFEEAAQRYRRGGRSGESEGTTQSSQSKETTLPSESEYSEVLERSEFTEGGRRSDKEVQMRFEAKLAAGAFGILQAILHAVAVCVIMMTRGSENAQQFQPQPMYFQDPQQPYPQQPNAQPDPNATNQGQQPQAQTAS